MTEKNEADQSKRSFASVLLFQSESIKQITHCW